MRHPARRLHFRADRTAQRPHFGPESVEPPAQPRRRRPAAVHGVRHRMDSAGDFRFRGPAARRAAKIRAARMRLDGDRDAAVPCSASRDCGASAFSIRATRPTARAVTSAHVPARLAAHRTKFSVSGCAGFAGQVEIVNESALGRYRAAVLETVVADQSFIGICLTKETWHSFSFVLTKNDVMVTLPLIGPTTVWLCIS